jgi:hypothetical protein
MLPYPLLAFSAARRSSSTVSLRERRGWHVSSSSSTEVSGQDDVLTNLRAVCRHVCHKTPSELAAVDRIPKLKGGLI